jgi:hypothetical protein
MTVRIRTITFDCSEPYRLSLFWSQVTGFTEDPDDPNLPEHTENALIGPPGTPNLLFIRVPEGKFSVQLQAALSSVQVSGDHWSGSSGISNEIAVPWNAFDQPFTLK